MYIIHYPTYQIMKLILLSLILYITCANALNPVCRGRLRSDLKFKYSYDSHIIDSSKDLDFNQRGNLARCASSGTQIYTDSTTGSTNCDSIATGEGPGLDRFGWASQTMVGKQGKVKFYSPYNSLASADQEFTTGTKCGTKVVLPTGAVWGAAVCEKAVHLYFYDDTQWLDRGEIAFPDATGNDIDIDVNHEDYLIVRAGSKVFIYKLGMFPEKKHELTGDGLVAASVNCKGSVFAYESAGAIKLKQLDQSDGTTWSDLTDISVDPVSMEMSSDVLAVGTTGKVQLYLFANGGTSYDEYKAIDGLSAKNFGKKLALKHDDLAVADDDNIYLFKEKTPTKCRHNQKLVNDECVACEGTESNPLDTTSSTCTPLTCTANQYILNGACTACPGSYTSAGGSVTECVCAAGRFIDSNSDCTSCPAGSSSAAEGSTECVCTGAGKTWDAATEACVGIKCAADEHVVSNVCTACPAGSTNAADDDASGANTDCDVTTCAANEHVVSNVCTACADGSSRPAGDLATGADTACTADHTCLVNQYYNATSKTCIACPAGSTKDVAVDSLGGDSTCDPIICGANMRVKSNACTPCPAGSEIAAGSDATGADTFCTCPANSRVVTTYASDNTKKYGSTSCTGTSDCETKCTADSNCGGYSQLSDEGRFFFYYGGPSGNKQHACRIETDGAVKCTGENQYGSLGDGTNTDRTTWVSVSGIDGTSASKKAVYMCGAYEAVHVVMQDGSMKAWGYNAHGRLGDGSTTNRNTPIDVSGVDGTTDAKSAVSCSSNDNGACILMKDGKVKCMGWGAYGFLGDGSTSNNQVPGEVTDVSDAVYLAVGGQGGCAILSTGAMKCWGEKYPGDGSSNDDTTRTAVSVSGIDGTTDAKSAVSVSVGQNNKCALMKDGKLKCWGGNTNGELGDGTTTHRTTPVEITVSGAGTIKQVAMGSYHTCVLGSDVTNPSNNVNYGGNVYCVGENGDRQLGDATNTDRTSYVVVVNALAGKKARYLYAKANLAVAILEDGTVIDWGQGDLVDFQMSTITAYGPLTTGTGTSFMKSKGCSACGTNEERPAGDPTNGPETQCSCSAGSEGDGSACQTCPANSNSIAGHIKDMCVKNEGAIWHDEVVNGAADAGACTASLDCTSKVGDPSTCIQPYEDGGVLQITTPCCKIEKPLKCLCDENFRVAGNVCTACTGGETRPAGDDPDGVNTYCSTEGIGLAFGNNGDTDFTYLGQNDPIIELKVGQKYSFLRDTAGHPLRIVSEEDCSGKGCDTGTYTSLPTSTVTSVEAKQGVANIVWRPKRAGTYFYVCTAHSEMVGRITVVWDTCNFPHKGAFSLTQSCKITSDFALQGDVLINAPSARLRSTDEKPLLSYEATGAMSIDGGSYNFEMHNVEVQPPEESDALIKGSGDFVLNNVDIKESGEWRDSDRDGVFTSNGGKIVAQNMAIHNVAGLSFKATGGGDVSLADVTISGSYTGNSDSYQSNYDFSEAVIGVKGGVITMRNVQMTGGWKLAQMEDATSLFEAVTMDGNKGIKGKNTGIQMERSTIKNLDGKYAIDLDNSGQDNKDKELLISNSTIKDNRGDTNGPISVKVHSTTSYRSKIKLIEVDFSGNKKADNTARDIYSNQATDMYVVDPVSDPTISGPTLKEECYDHQCAHKPLASTCKVESGKGTKCSCEVGVATYNSGTMSFERQTHLKEVLATLFATADVGDRIVKLVDRQSRYTPASATPEEAKSNLILTKPTNTDGKFVSERTILMRPATGQLCTSFRTWLCNELTMCHYSNGTITAECDGTKILTPASNAATRRLRSIQKWKVLKAVHPDDPNCAGSITNLKQQCTATIDGSAVSYERCVRGAHFIFNDCKCQDGTVANSGLTACVDPNDACRQNERVFQGRCVACPAGQTNIAGDDRTGSNTVCDDVVCATNQYADGTGLCKPCASGEYNIGGDIAFNKGTGAKITSSCCASEEYETAYTASTGTRTCAACSGIKTAYKTTLKCCSGQKLGDDTYTFQCPRIMEYWRNVCSQADGTCPARNY